MLKFKLFGTFIIDILQTLRIQAESINADRHTQLMNIIIEKDISLVGESSDLSRWQRVKRACKNT